MALQCLLVCRVKPVGGMTSRSNNHRAQRLHYRWSYQRRRWIHMRYLRRHVSVILRPSSLLTSAKSLQNCQVWQPDRPPRWINFPTLSWHVGLTFTIKDLLVRKTLGHREYRVPERRWSTIPRPVSLLFSNLLLWRHLPLGKT